VVGIEIEVEGGTVEGCVVLEGVVFFELKEEVVKEGGVDAITNVVKPAGVDAALVEGLVALEGGDVRDEVGAV